MKEKKFTDYLVEKGLIAEDELNRILEVRKEKGGSLVELLVKMGNVQEPRIVNILSDYLSIPPVRILHLNIPKEVLSLVPERIARFYQVLPMGKLGGTLTLAMADPLNILAIDDIKKITKCEINPAIAPFSEIKEAISSSYAREPGESIEEIIKGQKTENLKIIKEGRQESATEAEIIRSVEEAPIIKFTDSLLKRAVEAGVLIVLSLFLIFSNAAKNKNKIIIPAQKSKAISKTRESYKELKPKDGVSQEYTLEGIVYDANSPLAVINGKAVRKADIVGEFVVDSIGESEVRLTGISNDSKLILSLP